MEEVLILNEGASFADGTLVVQEERKKLNKFQEFYKEKMLDSSLSKRIDEDILGCFSIGGAFNNFLVTLYGFYFPPVILLCDAAGKLMSKAFKTTGNVVVSGKHFVEGKIFGLEEFLTKKPPIEPTESPVRGPMIIPDEDFSDPVKEEQTNEEEQIIEEESIIEEKPIIEEEPIIFPAGECVTEKDVNGGHIFDENLLFNKPLDSMFSDLGKKESIKNGGKVR